MPGEGVIRRAEARDVAAMVELSERKRLEYQSYEPRFWRKAADSREKQTPHFERVLSGEQAIAFVHEGQGEVDGFIVGVLVEAPPVYDPGGLTCLVDDFVVDAQDWDTVGAALLAAVEREAGLRGAVQTVVVCGHRDEAKRAALAGERFSLTSEWYTRGIG
jgi:GNAT superfamily N-acetyltransferase